MASLDEVDADVHVRLQSATRDVLLAVYAELGLEDGDGKTNPALLRRVRKHLSSDAVEGQEDEGLAVLQKVLKVLKETPSGTQQPETQPAVQGEEAVSSQSCAPSSTEVAAGPVFRREFKIFGQIGDAGQKDKITFLSLMHQIEAGLARKYKEREVVEAVIRAINPASRLRSYLEGKPSLTLADLRRILRSHYGERDATELYYQLSRARQDVKESPQEFLIRAMDLQQKVRFVSKELTAGPKYEAEQVRAMFLHSLQTGFRSEGVRTDMRPYLQDPNITDEELLEKLNIAASHEAELQQKMNGSRPTTVSSVSHNTPDLEPSKTSKPNPLVEDVKELKLQVAALVAALQAGGNQSTNSASNRATRPRGPPRKWGCQGCQTQGVGDQCRHCFKCGSPDHYMRNCSNQPGNGQGLPPRGEQ